MKIIDINFLSNNLYRNNTNFVIKQLLNIWDHSINILTETGLTCSPILNTQFKKKQNMSLSSECTHCTFKQAFEAADRLLLKLIIIYLGRLYSVYIIYSISCISDLHKSVIIRI